jgi:hypothetical protein
MHEDHNEPTTTIKLEVTERLIKSARNKEWLRWLKEQLDLVQMESLKMGPDAAMHAYQMTGPYDVMKLHAAVVARIDALSKTKARSRPRATESGDQHQ